VADLGFAEAFARYGAKLRNVQWSVCAVSSKGELVVSLWEELFDKKAIDGALHYRDTFSRWSGPGNNELRQAVAEALSSQQRVRAVIAHAKEPGGLESGVAGSHIKKTFSIRDDLIGTVQSIDGDDFVFRFVRAQRATNLYGVEAAFDAPAA
jgi:hypothetical protein